jgi:hypothetical protein
MSRCLDSSSNQDKRAANEDADATTIAIGKKSAEGKCSNLAKVVDDEDDAGGRTFAGQAEGSLKGLHGVDGTHK